jgi:Mrp family chromosome partitioning ATPase
VLQDSLDGRLTVLPPGERPADPGEVLASPRLAATIRDLTDRFDIVLVDAPALQPVADATVLGKVTDTALLVVRADHTRLADVAKSKDLLERIGARLAGAVLNALPRKLPTGSAWHRELASAPDTELVAGLYGDDDDAGAEDAGPDTAVEPAEPVVARAPVRGRARVVQATIVSEDEDDDEAAAPDSGGAARGQARVVVITDAREPANLPVQRPDPDEGPRDGA